MKKFFHKIKKSFFAIFCVSIIIMSAGFIAGCGKKGDKGDRGLQGEKGSVWYVEAYAPTQKTSGRNGDMFLDSSTYDLYQKTNSGWKFIGNIKGKEGSKGDRGWKGENGDEIQLTVDNGEIKWKYENSQSWNILISLTALTGQQGESAHEVEFDTSDTHIQWRYVAKSGEDQSQFQWRDLVELSVLSGLGQNGKSAYELACEKGFKGTELEWLESLKGDNGSLWHIEDYSPEDDYDAQIGDLYLDTSTYNLYKLTIDGWDTVGNIKGDSPTISINGNGYWEINGTPTNVLADQTKAELVGEILAYNYLQTSDFIGKKITIVGDSITVGVGASDKTTTSYAAILASTLGVTVENLGINGTTLCDNVVGPDGVTATCRLSDIKSYNKQTDYFIIQLGVNDWIRSVSAKLYLGALGSDNTDTFYGALNVYARTLTQKFANTNTKIIFTTPIVCKSVVGTYDSNIKNKLGYSLRDMCNAIIETASLYDIAVLDLNIESGIYYNSEADNNTSTHMSDIVHPNDVGHNAIAQALIKFLQNNYEYVKRTDTKKVNLKFYSPENGSFRTLINYVVEGGNFKLPACPKQRSGYSFKCWQDDGGNNYFVGDVVKVDQNISLEAVYVTSVNLTVNNIIGSQTTSQTYQLDYTGEIDEQTDMLVTQSLNDAGCIVAPSYGLVPRIYSDQNLTQKITSETRYLEGESPTIYVYWETNPQWFVVSDGVITDKTNDFPIDYDSKNSLQKLIFPRHDINGNLITSINSNAFFLNQLESTGSTTKTIGAAVLKNVSEIYFPQGYTSIAGNFFLTARGSINTTTFNALTITIPQSLTNITELAFGNLNVLNYNISDQNTAYSSKDGMWLNKTQTTLVRYVNVFDGSNVQTSYTIPETIKSIGAYAFYGNKNLTSLVVSKNIASAFGTNTIAFTSNLSQITFECEVENCIKSNSITSSQNASFISSGSIYVKDEQDKTYLVDLFNGIDANLYKDLVERIHVS